MSSQQPWHHGNITRSRAEDLLSKAGKDGSFLLRDSESITGAYALCVLFQNCVYTYRILPNDEKKLSVQASEGVPIRFFTKLTDLVEAYYKEHMGLVTRLQFPVQKEEELEEEQVSQPPQLPPRNLPAPPSRDAEVSRPSISDVYLQRLQHVDASSLPEDHQKFIQEYFRQSIVLDAEQVQNGNPTLPNLKKLLMTICKSLNNEISRCLPSLETIQKVLEQPMSPGSSRLKSQVSADMSPSVAFRLEQLMTLLYSIEDKTSAAVFESVGYDGGHRNSLIPPATFEVKSAESLGISSKMYLKVDVEGGKLYFKKSKEGAEDKYFVHNKILQLVKSPKSQKLVVVLETEKEKTVRKEFVFDDTKKREGFCQLLQLMKNKHSGKPEPDMITIFVGTWNMGNANPPPSLASWFKCKGQGKTRDDTASQIPHDIYVIGTQEDPLGEKEWMDVVKGELRNITNISFKQDCCSVFNSDTLAGNKGAVGVSFMFNRTSFGFVNSHLTSGSEKKLRRNQNYTSILRFLNLGDKKLNPFDITHRFTHLFWLGDLNYRIELPFTEAENIVTKIKQQHYPELLRSDQLTMERSEEKVFLEYVEEEITFAPTYRFERDTREKYAYTKAKATGTKYNLPSWCDRVLRKSYPSVHVVCQSYGESTCKHVLSLRHTSLFALHVVKLFPYPTKLSEGGITFIGCQAILKTKSNTKFSIEFHSSCLEKFVKSAEGENQVNSEGSIKVRFGSQIELIPIISDPEFLLDQHVLISVKSTDGDESFGEGCVALRSAERSYTEFEITLTHHGERTGTLSGGVQVRTSEGKQTEKLYVKPVLVWPTFLGQLSRCRSTHVSDFSNPSYSGLSFKSSGITDRKVNAYGHVAKETSGNLSPKKTQSPTGRASELNHAEMFDNPLYGSMSKLTRGKEPEHLKKDLLMPPDGFFIFPKPSETDPERPPPIPSPRIRSYTSSETKPQAPPPPSTTSTTAGPSCASGSGLQPQSYVKRPVVPSRSEAGIIRPPVAAPIKCRAGQEPQVGPQVKPRDYRDSCELPNKLRATNRPSPPLPKEGSGEITVSPPGGWLVLLQDVM
uniref:phosphatidylinositol-3,4,5-trisphosphate 5-phosphatase n=1 Tax=Denticeps clupeoides TaxID=299321 RepID=A0AAY4EUM3_9TELE